MTLPQNRSIGSKGKRGWKEGAKQSKEPIFWVIFMVFQFSEVRIGKSVHRNIGTLALEFGWVTTPMTKAKKIGGIILFVGNTVRCKRRSRRCNNGGLIVSRLELSGVRGGRVDKPALGLMMATGLSDRLKVH
jgi:hypothetical protein